MTQLAAQSNAVKTCANDAQTCSYGCAVSNWPEVLSRIGRSAPRYGLVAVLVWIGAMKFTAYEAEAISGLVANSPLMSWAYEILSHRQFAASLGIVELVIAAMIALKPWWPAAGLAGAAAAVGMFLTTFSFMVTTPGVFEPTAGGFPAVSVVPGQFLVKDLGLLGISIWLLADAVRGVRSRKTTV